MIVQFAFLCLLRLIFEETSLPKEWTFFLNCQCYYEKQIDNNDIVFMVFTLKDLRNTIKLYVQNFSVKPLAWSSWFDHMIMRFLDQLSFVPYFSVRSSSALRYGQPNDNIFLYVILALCMILFSCRQMPFLEQLKVKLIISSNV